MTTRLVALNPKRNLRIWGIMILASWLGFQLLAASYNTPFGFTLASLIDYELMVMAFGLGSIVYMAYDQLIGKKMLTWLPDRFVVTNVWGKQQAFHLADIQTLEYQLLRKPYEHRYEPHGRCLIRAKQASGKLLFAYEALFRTHYDRDHVLPQIVTNWQQAGWRLEPNPGEFDWVLHKAP